MTIANYLNNINKRSGARLMREIKQSDHPKTRNISNKNLQEIYDFIENFKPKNKLEERNLIILKYA